MSNSKGDKYQPNIIPLPAKIMSLIPFFLNSNFMEVIFSTVSSDLCYSEKKGNQVQRFQES